MVRAHCAARSKCCEIASLGSSCTGTHRHVKSRSCPRNSGAARLLQLTKARIPSFRTRPRLRAALCCPMYSHGNTWLTESSHCCSATRSGRSVAADELTMSTAPRSVPADDLRRACAAPIGLVTLALARRPQPTRRVQHDARRRQHDAKVVISAFKIYVTRAERRGERWVTRASRTPGRAAPRTRLHASGRRTPPGPCLVLGFLPPHTQGQASRGVKRVTGTSGAKGRRAPGERNPHTIYAPRCPR